MKKATLFLWEGGALFLGPLSDISRHTHPAAQFCLALEGEFTLHTTAQTLPCRYAAIAPNVPHQLENPNKILALGLIDGETTGLGEMSDIQTITNKTWPHIIPQLPRTISQARSFLNWLVHPDQSCNHPQKTSDQRITKILPRLHAVEHLLPTPFELAEQSDLSESRFQHLFKQSMGIPMRRYILWRRIKTTINHITNGLDLTAAAHLGGFADSAHFSRTFRETFGLSPSQLFKNSRNIQVICEDTI